MKILSLIIAGKHPIDKNIMMLSKYYDLDSIGFLYRGTVKDSFKFVVRESLTNLEKSTRHKVKHE